MLMVGGREGTVAFPRGRASRAIVYLLICVVLGALTSSQPVRGDVVAVKTPIDDPAVRDALAGPTLGLSFTHTNDRPPRRPGVAVPPLVMKVLTNIEHRTGSVQRLASISVESSGALVQATAWERGMERVLYLDAATCEVQSFDMPAEGSLYAVIADMIGPVTDPLRAGFTLVSATVVERDEGPVIQRISNFGDLRRRVVDFVSTRDGSVHSTISSISLSRVLFELRTYVDKACPTVMDNFVRLLAPST